MRRRIMMMMMKLFKHWQASHGNQNKETFKFMKIESIESMNLKNVFSHKRGENKKWKKKFFSKSENHVFFFSHHHHHHHHNVFHMIWFQIIGCCCCCWQKKKLHHHYHSTTTTTNRMHNLYGIKLKIGNKMDPKMIGNVYGSCLFDFNIIIIIMDNFHHPYIKKKNGKKQNKKNFTCLALK